MTKSELAAKTAKDMEEFLARKSVTVVPTQTPQEIKEAAAARRNEQYRNDSQYDAETGGIHRDQHGRMARSPQ